MIRILENSKTQIAFFNRELYNDTNPNKLFVPSPEGFIGYLRFERFNKNGCVILSSDFKINAKYATATNQKRGERYEHTVYPSMVLGIKQDTSVIPKGNYCYSRGENGEYIPCPYWSLNKHERYQDNGYCSYLGIGDWESPCGGLIWDQMKSCGINDDFEDDDKNWFMCSKCCKPYWEGEECDNPNCNDGWLS